MPYRRRRKKRSAERRRLLRPAKAPPARRDGLRAVSRAQLGRDEEARPYRLREDDASVEDPLGDWPEEC
jgi:hypothetical protein